MRALVLIAATPLLLAGCVAGAEQSSPDVAAAEPVNFICDRSDSVSVSFAGENAVLSANGQSAKLQQQPSGSGFRYTGEGHDIRGKGHELTWQKPDGAVRSCREKKWAMQQPQIQPPMQTLAGSIWQLVHFQSSDDAVGTKIPPSVERYTIEFMSDGRAALQLDCNRATAQWEAVPSSASGGALTFKGGPMTRAMCQPGAMDNIIAQDLGRVRSYTFQGNRIGLALEADSGIYLWERKN